MNITNQNKSRRDAENMGLTVASGWGFIRGSMVQ